MGILGHQAHVLIILTATNKILQQPSQHLASTLVVLSNAMVQALMPEGAVEHGLQQPGDGTINEEPAASTSGHLQSGRPALSLDAVSSFLHPGHEWLHMAFVCSQRIHQLCFAFLWIFPKSLAWKANKVLENQELTALSSCSLRRWMWSAGPCEMK